MAKAIAKKDFTEAHVASALIDGARKKLEKAKTEDDQNIKKRKEIDEIREDDRLSVKITQRIQKVELYILTINKVIS